MVDYPWQDYRRQDDQRAAGRGSGALAIPQDSLRRLELAGFRIRPTTMAPLQASSTHTHYTSATPYRGNCRRSSARSRTRSGDSKYSELSDASAYTAHSKAGPAPPPIAGDVFAMHPELLAPATQDHTEKETTTHFSPLAYWKRKRFNSGASSAQSRAPSPSASSQPHSVIFIDVPTHSE